MRVCGVWTNKCHLVEFVEEMSHSYKGHSDDDDPHEVGDVACDVAQLERAVADVRVVDDVTSWG